MPTIVHNYRPERADATVTMTATGSSPLARTPAAAAARRSTPAASAATIGGSPPARSARATVTATATTESDSDAVELPVPVLPFGVQPRGRQRAARIVGAGEATATLTIPAGVESGRPIDLSRAGAVAGRLGARRARLPHRLSLRLHRADAVELPAQPAGDARADRTEARADRAPVGARPPGVAGLAAALRLSARRRRLGMVEDRRRTIRS